MVLIQVESILRHCVTLNASQKALFRHFRADKEKSKFQQEVYELLAQLDNVTKEKLMSIKTVEKLEIHVSELNVKIEELNRTIVDITSHKTRLSQENIELVKEVQDLKVEQSIFRHQNGTIIV